MLVEDFKVLVSVATAFVFWRITPGTNAAFVVVDGAVPDFTAAASIVLVLVLVLVVVPAAGAVCVDKPSTDFFASNPSLPSFGTRCSFNGPVSCTVRCRSRRAASLSSTSRLV